MGAYDSRIAGRALARQLTRMNQRLRPLSGERTFVAGQGEAVEWLGKTSVALPRVSSAWR